MIYRLNKRGSTTATLPLILVISVIILIVIGMFIINTITPFIWYQKLNTVVSKYMFVIEKYGYLTQTEKQNLLGELEDRGFDKNKVDIEAPSSIKTYGELIEFRISYSLLMKHPTVNNLIIGIQEKNINIKVEKNSFCKR